MSKSKRISMSSWLLLISYALIMIALVWQSLLPLFAELSFRNGYGFDVFKRYKYAIEELRETVHYAPWEPHYQFKLASYYEKYAQSLQDPAKKIAAFEQALDVLKTCIELDQYNPWYRNRVTIIYASLIQIDPERYAHYHPLIRENIQIAAELDSENPLFLMKYATMLHQENQPDQASAYYRKVVTIDPSFLTAWYNLAMIRQSEGDFSGALSDLLQLQKESPDYPGISRLIGSLYIQLGEISNAIFHLEQAQSKGTDLLDIEMSLAALYFQNKQFMDAVRTYESIQGHSPDQFNTVRVFYIQALSNAGKIPKAARLCQQYLQETPNDPDLLSAYQTIRNYLER